MTYEYACQSCSCEWEAEHRIGQAPKRITCPVCKRRTGRLQVTGGQGFQLRGENWPGKEAARKA